MLAGAGGTEREDVEAAPSHGRTEAQRIDGALLADEARQLRQIVGRREGEIAHIAAAPQQRSGHRLPRSPHRQTHGSGLVIQKRLLQCHSAGG